MGTPSDACDAIDADCEKRVVALCGSEQSLKHVIERLRRRMRRSFPLRIYIEV
jgi:hypothetical protein